MRYLLLVVLLAAVGACDDDGSSRPCSENLGGRWPVWADSMNLGILLLDYQTRELEGGTLLHYARCDTCGTQMLPLAIDYDAPGDVGRITFRYTSTGQTVFDASIIWMGTGRIVFPTSFASPDSFRITECGGGEPRSFKYFEFSGCADQEDLLVGADSVWSEIRSLDIVRSFAQDAFNVGFYMYPPSVGVCDDRKAKWVVFLHSAGYGSRNDSP